MGYIVWEKQVGIPGMGKGWRLRHGDASLAWRGIPANCRLRGTKAKVTRGWGFPPTTSGEREALLTKQVAILCQAQKAILTTVGFDLN